MTLIGILAGIAVPLYYSSVIKAREAALKEDLYQLREAIDKYSADHGAYPDGLSVLVEKKYVRSIPVDPVTDSSETWIEVQAEGSSGIYDVKSGSGIMSTDGTAYNEW